MWTLLPEPLSAGALGMEAPRTAVGDGERGDGLEEYGLMQLSRPRAPGEGGGPRQAWGTRPWWPPAEQEAEVGGCRQGGRPIADRLLGGKSQHVLMFDAKHDPRLLLVLGALRKLLEKEARTSGLEWTHEEGQGG